MIRKIILISVFSWASFLNAQNTYVLPSMGGDDTNAGSLTLPLPLLIRHCRNGLW